MSRNLPLGIPQLMMGFMADGQADPGLVQVRDRKFDVSTQSKKESRSDIQAPNILPGAGAWQKGNVVQPRLEPVR